jgi:glutamate---cysteine ligase / carboxylate-amine ligase
MVTDDALAGKVAELAASNMPDVFSLGIEEEFLLVDPDTAQVVPAVDAVIKEVRPGPADLVQREFLTTQIEIGTRPSHSLSMVRDSLAEMRTAVCEAAERAGVRVAAIGGGPLPLEAPPPVVQKPRFKRMIGEFGALCPTPGLSACHIHVGVPNRELGVQVLNHLRFWLPVLQGVTANSPFADGVDTRYASWRSIQWARWPTVGPSPHLSSAAHYDQVLEDLGAAGAMLDDGMLYWYARLSAHLPTVEVRVGDVCPTIEDTLLIAGLVRGLVATVVDEVSLGEPPRRARDWLVSAAHWRAARDGLEGQSVDVDSGSTVPAWTMLRRLFDHVRPALDRHGDTAVVSDLLELLASRGGGAHRQREQFARSGDLRQVVRWVAAATKP